MVNNWITALLPRTAISRDLASPTTLRPLISRKSAKY
jgi:hypothetical protein